MQYVANGQTSLMRYYRLMRKVVLCFLRETDPVVGRSNVPLGTFARHCNHTNFSLVSFEGGGTDLYKAETLTS